jgi:hypothetical protein
VSAVTSLGIRCHGNRHPSLGNISLLLLAAISIT